MRLKGRSVKHCTGYAEYQTVNKIEGKMEESMAATNETLHRITVSADDVASGSVSVSDGAQILCTG